MTLTHAVRRSVSLRLKRLINKTNNLNNSVSKSNILQFQNRSASVLFPPQHHLCLVTMLKKNKYKLPAHPSGEKHSKQVNTLGHLSAKEGDISPEEALKNEPRECDYGHNLKYMLLLLCLDVCKQGSLHDEVHLSSSSVSAVLLSMWKMISDKYNMTSVTIAKLAFSLEVTFEHSAKACQQQCAFCTGVLQNEK